MDAAPILRKALAHPLYNLCVVMLTLVRMWVCFQYGLLDKSTLDTIGIIGIGVSAAEVFMRVMAYGWTGYWIADNKVNDQMANRWAFVHLAYPSPYGLILPCIVLYAHTHAFLALFAVVLQIRLLCGCGLCLLLPLLALL